jgi:predicted nucleic acid-binding protein
MLDGKSLETNTAEEVITQPINFGGNAAFRLRFYRDSNDPRTIMLESTGSSSNVTRKISMDMGIRKDNSLLHFAIASKTRVWITGDSTIHGNIYSSWKYQNISPFNITSDSKVEGSINTVLTNTNPDTGQLGDDLYADTTEVPYDLETLTADGKPKYNVLSEPVYDEAGNAVSVVTGDYMPLFDSEGNRVYDGSGNLVYNIAGATDLYGNPLYDGEGNPVNIVYGGKVVSASDELQGE